ncbi:MAG: hypothetical protein K2X27_00960 [Candidatus Obscuribacterales bacterium]|nr:hypothetical protein [Candidatus Obscuribacterales bacterium]
MKFVNARLSAAPFLGRTSMNAPCSCSISSAGFLICRSCKEDLRGLVSLEQKKHSKLVGQKTARNRFSSSEAPSAQGFCTRPKLFMLILVLSGALAFFGTEFFRKANSSAAPAKETPALTERHPRRTAASLLSESKLKPTLNAGNSDPYLFNPLSIK